MLGTHPAFHGIENPWDLPINHPFHIAAHAIKNPTAFPGSDNSIHGEVPRQIAMLSNRHYWISMGLLEISYRTDGRFHAAARRPMAGPLLQLCRHLTEAYGVPAPFDKFPMDFYGGLSLVDQSDMLVAILRDIEQEEQRLLAYLPSAYVQSSRETCIELLQILLAKRPFESAAGTILSDEQLLVSATNWFAENDNVDGYLVLTEHPTKVDIGIAKAQLLFDNAPFRSVNEMLSLNGIGEASLSSMTEAIKQKWLTYSNNATTPTYNSLLRIVAAIRV